MTRYKLADHDDKVRYLFSCKLSPEAIASRLGVELRSVKNALIRMNLSRPQKQGRPYNVPPEPPAEKLPVVNAPMSMALHWFGSRLTEAGGTYRLNGTPIRFSDLMKRMNAERVAKGKDQVGHPDWRVT